MGWETTSADLFSISIRCFPFSNPCVLYLTIFDDFYDLDDFTHPTRDPRWIDDGTGIQKSTKCRDRGNYTHTHIQVRVCISEYCAYVCGKEYQETCARLYGGSIADLRDHRRRKRREFWEAGW